MKSLVLLLILLSLISLVHVYYLMESSQTFLQTTQDGSKDLNEKLLEQIEKRIKDPKVLTPDEMREFFKSIVREYGEEAVLSAIETRLKDKEVYYIRHAQSTYNKWAALSALNFAWTYENKVENYDPVLTEEGIQACNLQAETLDKEHPFDADLVLVSPLTRAMQTAKAISRSKCFSNVKTLVATQLIRERTDCPGDIGKPKSVLEKTFPEIDFSYIAKESWWNYVEEDKIGRDRNGAEHYARESEVDAKTRVAMTLLWITMRPEKTVVMVSHSGFYRAIYNIGIFGKNKAKNNQCVKIGADTISSNIREQFKQIFSV